MSTEIAVTPAVHASYSLGSVAFPHTSCVSLILNANRRDNEVRYRFVFSANLNETTEIGVLQLLAECKHHVPPSGFHIEDNNTLKVYYNFLDSTDPVDDTDEYVKELQREAIANAMDRLRERAQIICDQRDFCFERDPLSHRTLPRR